LAIRHGSHVVSLRVGEPDDSEAAEASQALFESGGVQPEVRIERGSPHRRIVEVAHEVNASLIVMGSRGRAGVAALGSVSERVSHRAGCSVLVVRRPSHTESDDYSEAG
jgi:nucleotide-binding universal stress UspA family protein